MALRRFNFLLFAKDRPMSQIERIKTSEYYFPIEEFKESMTKLSEDMDAFRNASVASELSIGCMSPRTRNKFISIQHSPKVVNCKAGDNNQKERYLQYYDNRFVLSFRDKTKQADKSFAFYVLEEDEIAVTTEEDLLSLACFAEQNPDVTEELGFKKGKFSPKAAEEKATESQSEFCEQQQAEQATQPPRHVRRPSGGCS